ncbi:cytochrome c oxidase subunit 4 [Mumia sp. zg.B53]|uniref:cytochrome c oxidase subunit 4 n=1 Tax=unclassified Mumia TaxID=2621872 RepID=UPI001C6E8C27|nr:MULTISPECIES: cytochrome c oxidase subunit 4 [unclassified Mumia]MBW9206293.1 cytochrome c oxidase subunit 4 [Mumia sp. zg.B17]MBW9211413.1 cytochrome c oxidase subunit 4 [Mumia sp. zg.B21]MBW9216586.1 cytochrome c oxidase subunit 4 [Mumia sp. zg.B53]MDD9349351.1 cytochrome c oxidase subunit 4 [Mumia sp.]
MKAEAWIIASISVFLVIVSPIYWIASGDPTGTTALVMAALLGLLLTFFLGVVAKQIPARLEDRDDGEIAEGAGEYGFYPPWSWWPLWAALAMLAIILGLIFGWWLVVMALPFGVIALVGWIYEYYRGLYAH